MKEFAREGLLGSLAKIDLPICEYYLVGKTTRKPSSRGTKTKLPLQLVHSTVCDPLNVRARNGASYFIPFIDDFMCFGYVFLIFHKLEAIYCF